MSDNERKGLDQANESDTTSTEDEAELIEIAKLKVPENIQAFLSNTELLRDEESVPCESKLAEKVVTNYIIAKKILSYVSWREKLLYKTVCTTWRSAVNALARERLYPVDFIYDLKQGRYGTFVKSMEIYNEPMAVISFIKLSGMSALACGEINPPPCDPPCENLMHSLLDAIYQQVCAPKTCMLSVIGCSLTYMPVPNSVTKPLAPTKWGLPLSHFTGVSIPVIPGVKFHILNIKQIKDTVDIDLQKDFYDEVDKISQDQIVKGALVFVTDKYLLQSEQDISMLNYLKEVQPDVPYAMGGCLIEDTLYGEEDLEMHIKATHTMQQCTSKTLISVALFTVPKDYSDERDRYNFDMFSLIVLPSEWTKDKIKSAIDEFAKSVPRYEHSVALKLSCVGRDKKHILEQDLFRMAFPDTPLFGCYGNGELGINNPPRATPHPQTSKKRKVETGQPRLLYSYSTVFVYMGWGKITTPDPDTPKK